MYQNGTYFQKRKFAKRNSHSIAYFEGKEDYVSRRLDMYKYQVSSLLTEGVNYYIEGSLDLLSVVTEEANGMCEVMSDLACHLSSEECDKWHLQIETFRCILAANRKLISMKK